MATIDVTAYIVEKIKSWHMDADNVKIMEMGKEHRTQGYSLFHVRATSAGSGYDLGYWKINLATVDFIGVALQPEGKLLSPDDFSRELRRMIKAEEALRESRDSEIASIWARLAELYIKRIEDLLYPFNHLRSAIASILDSFVSRDYVERVSSDAKRREKRMWGEMEPDIEQDARDACFQLLDDLCFYAAACRRHRSVMVKDVDDASEFLRGLLLVCKRRIAGYEIGEERIDSSKLVRSGLVQAFSQWVCYARLPEELRDPGSLFVLLSDAAGLNFAKDLLLRSDEKRAAELLGVRG